jgi:hypothetical protein
MLLNFLLASLSVIVRCLGERRTTKELAGDRHSTLRLFRALTTDLIVCASVCVCVSRLIDHS